MTSKDACLTLDWIGDAQTGCLRLLDQTLLPTKVVTIDCHDVETVWEAIRNLRVRGAPAIGVAAAYGCVIAARSGPQGLKRGADLLRTSRPTAVNLFWAIDRMEAAARCAADITPDAFAGLLLEEARALHEADRAESLAMGRLGADLIHDGDSILTHCNAGGLATSEHGTALAVIFAAHEQGKSIRVYADETRPLLQGARLTAWELAQRHIPVTLICDNMAAHVMKQGKIHRVIVGADRIAANGDAANKIGTYGVAVLASAHGIPFYIAAPSSTFDLSIPDGSHIPIEERDPREITHGFGRQTAPNGIDVYNPAFDVTPAELIAGIITERGIITPVDREHVTAVLSH